MRKNNKELSKKAKLKTLSQMRKEFLAIKKSTSFFHQQQQFICNLFYNIHDVWGTENMMKALFPELVEEITKVGKFHNPDYKFPTALTFKENGVLKTHHSSGVESLLYNDYKIKLISRVRQQLI